MLVRPLVRLLVCRPRTACREIALCRGGLVPFHPPSTQLNQRNARRLDALGCDFMEAPPALGADGIFSCPSLPAPDRDIDKAGLDFQRAGPPPNPLGCKNRRSGPTETVEHNVATTGAVLDGIRNQRHGFHGGIRVDL